MYSDEIKTKALNLHANGVPAAEICKNLGIARSTLFLWIKQSKPDYRGAVPRKEYLEKTELERLRVENRIFRTCGCTPASPLSEKLEAIDRHKKQFNVYRLCKTLDVLKSTYPTKSDVIKAVNEYVVFLTIIVLISDWAI